MTGTELKIVTPAETEILGPEVDRLPILHTNVKTDRELLEVWLKSHRDGSAHTVRVYARVGERFVAALGDGGLRGDGRDEYWARIDLHATALAGSFAIGLILVMCVWEWAHGRDGTPYVQLGALTGVAYVASIGFLRWRS